MMTYLSAKNQQPWPLWPLCDCDNRAGLSLSLYWPSDRLSWSL